MANFHLDCYHLGMRPEDRGPVVGNARAGDSALHDSGKDEQWIKLLEWLQYEHGMDVSRSGLLVERRKAEGAVMIGSILALHSLVLRCRTWLVCPRIMSGANMCSIGRRCKLIWF